MPGPWTDAHCHLADPRLVTHLDAVIERSRAAGVVSWIQGGVGPDDWRRQKELRARLGRAVRLAFGVHPWWASSESDEDVDRALDALESEVDRADAIGELGLDRLPRWRKRDGALERQRRALSAQLVLARRTPRPLVLHVVRAHDAVLGELERHGPFPRGGIVHAFTGAARDARRYTELGFHLSLGGALAAHPERAREKLTGIDLAHVVVETDAPDQAPRAWQVDHNEPAFLLRIADALAPIWGISPEELLDRAHTTLQTLFAP